MDPISTLFYAIFYDSKLIAYKITLLVFINIQQLKYNNNIKLKSDTQKIYKS